MMSCLSLIQEWALQKAETMAVGEEARLLCPKCNGGSTAEKSLSITRQATKVLWYCHRSSCGTRGRVTSGVSTDEIAASESRGRLPGATRRFKGPTEELREDAAWYLTETYPAIHRLLLTEAGLRTCSYDGRIYIPIRDQFGRQVGEEIKRYPALFKMMGSGFDPPKSIAYRAPNQLSWFNRMLLYLRPSCEDTQLVVVEDSISAMAVSRYTDAVALLGTGLNAETAFDLMGHQAHKDNGTILLMLDRDAFKIGAKFYREYKALIPALRLVRIWKDPKDMELSELYAVLSKYR